MRCLTILLVLCLIVASPAWCGWAREPISQAAARDLLDEVWTKTRKGFYDPQMRSLDWGAVREKYERRLQGVITRGDMHRLLNLMLGELKTSHTQYLGAHEAMYYVLASTFGTRADGFPRKILNRGKIQIDDPGFFTVDTPEGRFVKAILEGGPAAAAGLKVGDRILSVDGQPWEGVDSLRGKAGRLVAVRVQRSPRADDVFTLEIQPQMANPQDSFIAALKKSARVIQEGGRKIGYVHVWAFTDERVVAVFQEAMAETLKGVDAFIFDLRDGVGGGNFDFLLPWAQGVSRITFIDRSGERRVIPPTPPPMVVLINEGSRSAKEIYAYSFKRYRNGTLVGTRTAGAVTAGRLMYLSDGSMLYLAVAGVRVDGENLEGRGVTPDIVVERPIPYSNGADPQLTKAIKQATNK